MDDQRAWVIGEATAIAEKIGMKPPKIVFRENKLMGISIPVQLVTTEITGGVGTRTLEEPELRISQEVLERDDSGSIRYRLAAALLLGEPRRVKANRKRFERNSGLALRSRLALGVCHTCSHCRKLPESS